jgi:hypothetical protein
MSLVHSSRDQGDSGIPPALESLDDEQETEFDSLSSLAKEAVPMRDHAARELDGMREERIMAVVGNSGRRLPRPAVNARVLGAGGLAVALLALIAALASSDGGSPASGGAAAKPLHPAGAKLSGQDRQAQQADPQVKAHPRRRAAIPAKRRAARRHAQKARTHRPPANADGVPTQGEAPATESPPPASAPPPVAATTESAPPPASSPPPSTSTDPAGEQFGFER